MYDFLAEIKTQREPKTYSGVSLDAARFSMSCVKVYLDQVERRDLVEFVAHLKQQRKARSGSRMVQIAAENGVGGFMGGVPF